MLDILINAHGAAPIGIGGIWDAIVTDFSKLDTAAACLELDRLDAAGADVQSDAGLGHTVSYMVGVGLT